MAIIGIDLGTSNSAAAVLRGGRQLIIPVKGSETFTTAADMQTALASERSDALKAVLQEAGKTLYEHAAQVTPTGAKPGDARAAYAEPGQTGGRVVDAEYTVGKPK